MIEEIVGFRENPFAAATDQVARAFESVVEILHRGKRHFWNAMFLHQVIRQPFRLAEHAEAVEAYVTLVYVPHV